MGYISGNPLNTGDGFKNKKYPTAFLKITVRLD